jgi:phage gp29-like protein
MPNKREARVAPAAVWAEIEADLDAQAKDLGKQLDDYLASIEGTPDDRELAQAPGEEGQNVADRIADTYAQAGALALKPTVEHLLSAIETSTSPTDLKERLEKLYKHLDSSALGQVVQKALMLAELDGRWAVLEET